jgi:hypothetical protein
VRYWVYRCVCSCPRIRSIRFIRASSAPFLIPAPRLPTPFRDALQVPSPFLESALLAACPGLRESWDAHRRTFDIRQVPDDRALFDAVRQHVVGLLAAGRVAEFSRFARSLERLIGEADPILYDVLREELLHPLARDVRDAGLDDARVAPYLGARTALVWSTVT